MYAIKQVRSLFHLECRMLVQQDVVNIEIIVWPFCTIDQRASFDGHTTTVRFYLSVGFDYAGLHVKIYFNHITLFHLRSISK